MYTFMLHLHTAVSAYAGHASRQYLDLQLNEIKLNKTKSTCLGRIYVTFTSKYSINVCLPDSHSFKRSTAISIILHP